MKILTKNNKNENENNNNLCNKQNKFIKFDIFLLKILELKLQERVKL